MGDIRVFVSFPESTAVFAGETLQCKITFKNVSSDSASTRSPQHAPSSSYGQTLGAFLHERRVKSAPRQLPPPTDLRRPGGLSPRLPSRPPSAHNKSLSFSVPPLKSPPGTSQGRASHAHKRSLSIISIGSDPGFEAPVAGTLSPRPRGHARTSSLQISTRKQSVASDGSAPNSAALSSRGASPSTPMILESGSSTMEQFSFPAKPSTPTTSPRPYTPDRSPSKRAQLSFKFPPDPPIPEAVSPGENQPLTLDTDSVDNLNEKISHIDLQSPVEDTEYENIPGRVITAQSVNSNSATPRSSVDFYSMPNSTSETLASEYDPRGGSFGRSQHVRRRSLLSMGSGMPEILMMGYAHVTGSFIVDGSLIQSGIFEETKRKGVVGTHMGGGVVGLETHKDNGGFLGGFGWGSIASILGSSGMSSMAEMKHMASTKSVPILSTPQSILFVDLRLAPGESRSYMYKFTLPRGLPPSHRGKAIKISYNLVIGTQRPGKGVQQPTVIEIPFRVFPNVYEDGTMDTHDLQAPIVLLRDEATIEPLSASSPAPPPSRKPNPDADTPPTEAAFLSYVNSLLSPPKPEPASAGPSQQRALLSPTVETKRLSIYNEPPPTSTDAIEMAVLRTASSPTVFEIARNGVSVATVTFARPAYKLGETITCVIDFTNAVIPTYHLNASLEFSEKIDPNLALRSAASVHRATKKVYNQHSESTLFSKRLTFTPTIPSTATPEFVTSAISSAWVVRLEFITSVVSQRLRTRGEPEDDAAGGGLLECTFADDRGELWEPRQVLQTESFDAAIPVRVYPNGSDPSVGVGHMNPNGYVV